MNLKRIPFSYSREQQFNISYKDIILSHYYFADFVLYNSIILEIKAIARLSNSEVRQTLNYLAASKNKLGILVNFGEDSLSYKRILI